MLWKWIFWHCLWAKVPLFHAFPSTFTHHCGSEIIMWTLQKVINLKECQFCREPSRKWKGDNKQLFVQFIQALQQDNKEILLMLDANEEIGSTSLGISTILNKCSIIDILRHWHQEIRSPVTYNRGTKTIDYILGSAHCRGDAVERGGILPFYKNIQAEPHQSPIHWLWPEKRRKSKRYSASKA